MMLKIVHGSLTFTKPSDDDHIAVTITYTGMRNGQRTFPVKDSAWFFFELSVVCICNHCQYFSTPP
jgi:hypothetical protein